jgi:hypothetical protein
MKPSTSADFQSLNPLLKATTGIPAVAAAATEGFIASGLARVTAMPSTFESIALCIALA